MRLRTIQESTEYEASEIKILVISARNLPQYATATGRLSTADVMVELAFGDRIVSTQHVLANDESEAIFHQKWSLKLRKRSENALIIRIKDRKLGTIGTREFTIQSLEFHPEWSRNLPKIHWTFIPKSNEIDALTESGRLVQSHTRPCEVQLILIISRRRGIQPKIRHKNWWNCYRKPRPMVPKAVPVRRTRRWLVRDGRISQLEWDDSSEIPHEWTAMSVGHRTNIKKEVISALDRRGPNRQAFLRKQSRSQLKNLLDQSIVPVQPVPEQSVEAPPNTAVAANVYSSWSGEEPDVNPLIITSNKRFIGKLRSLTEVLDIMQLTEARPVPSAKSLWNSLPNAYIEHGLYGSVVLSGMWDSPYYRTRRRPIIRTIYPRRVPVTGRTVVTLTGQNLGESREDVLLLRIAGLDCLGDFEYLSRNKLRCTTRSFLVGLGTALIITRSGGRGRCRQSFEFYDAADLSHLQHILAAEDLDLGERVKLHEAALETEINQLVFSVVTHEQFNGDLLGYLTNLEQMVETDDPALFQRFRSQNG